MTAKYDFFRLRDESIGIAGNFIYKTVPHITLKSIAQNSNLDPIVAKHQRNLDAVLARCNAALKQVTAAVREKLQAKLLRKQKDQGRKAITDADRRRWEIPKDGAEWEGWQLPFDTDPDWPKELAIGVMEYRELWRAKMDEVNACIAANAEQEELVDQPEVVRGVVRVSGPFTVEAVQPPEMSLGDAKVITVDEFDGAPDAMETFEMRMVETVTDQEAQNLDAYLDQMMRYLKMDGVLFPNNKVMKFHRLEPVMDGSVIHAEGRWANGGPDADPEGRANIGVVFGPQYGPITAMQVEEAIRQANRRGYDHLVLAGFSFDGTAQAVIAESSHPKLKVHSAHIRPDVNPAMAGLLKEQPGSQLFSVFGQPRTRVDGPNAGGEYTVTMEGVDIYNPVDNTVTPTKADKVAAWFVDGDYDGRTFCITQAFFPDKSAWEKLSKALDGIVDAERFEAFSGTESLPFPAGKHKCVAVKVIDPRGNEVMRIHKLEARRG
jgi:adenine-specific DNA-methyltransferase